MSNCRHYGCPPRTVAVVHGGPGAAGELAPVARELGRRYGVLEPLQTADSIDGQIAELRDVLCTHGQTPCTLLGHSWGAWLSLLVAARHPELVRKLVLVGSAPLTADSAATILSRRLDRLSLAQRARLHTVLHGLDAAGQDADKDAMLAELGRLLSQTDTFAPLPEADTATVCCQEHIFRRVWEEAQALRQDGRLLAAVRRVRCPVVAIHGDYDPHPALGVREPLGRLLADFAWHLLPRCGHAPWKERYARDAFYRLLDQELGEE